MGKCYKAFLVFHDWRGAFNCLDGESCKKLLLAMFDYSEKGIEPPEFDGMAQMAAQFIFPAMERRAMAVENGRKGGNKRVENALARESVDNFVQNPVDNYNNDIVSTPLEPPLNPPPTTRQNKTRQDETKQDINNTRQDEDKTKADVSSVVGQAIEICGGWMDMPSGVSSKTHKLIMDYGYPIDEYTRLFRTANECDFLRGHGDRGWKATFDWLIEHMDEVNAGKYRTWGKDTSDSSFDTDDFFEAALRRAQEQINLANGGSNT